MVEIGDQEEVVIDCTSHLCLINLFGFGIESIKLKDIKQISVPNHHPTVEFMFLSFRLARIIQ